MSIRKNPSRSIKYGISPKASGNISQHVSKESLDAAKAENDYYRRQLMDKKAQITALEKKAPKLEEFRKLFIHLVQDFQQTGQITFFDNPEKLENPFDSTHEGIKVVRSGINQFISYHERLAARFELELSRNLFSLNQKLEEKKKILEQEEELLATANFETEHNENVIDLIVNEKDVLKKTIIMLRETLERHINSDTNQIGMINSKYQKVQNELTRIQNQVKAEDDAANDIANRQNERKSAEARQAATHQEILSTVEQLRADYKNESHSHNLTRAALDKAKEELTQLTRAVESYHDNLKTQELLGAEIENKRLRAVINIERIEFDEKLAKHTAKTNELSEIVDQLSNRIDQLNSQISATEQKLQTQMMRIPDFDQLSQVLDRSLAQSRKHKEFILKRKYLLDEIRDKNRLLEQMEIQESKNRMAQLKILMPLSNQQPENDNVLPALQEEYQRWQKEMKELLTSTGF
ncbi:hypothetical protein TRFO_19378 [Tritrichomonas foetus]|uniref:Uncharacterized protein n=1 Tax=Tritrichomonas foetus TaxID=1144522 RepID=A0A1J4KNA5_9EUKA|nr:hypothetical protein TRFO_19378 [Tritrichomonas foetus]|eukprot:OHT11276.1 hypothetical protein TRFO_19378 [Tritrichomonas foetus]